MFQYVRFFSCGAGLLLKEKKRPIEWKLPDLNKLPGGFRGKIYNKRDWNQYLDQHTQINSKEEPLSLKTPPKNWRKMNIPEYMKNKYALREKKLEMGVKGQQNQRKLSRKTIQGIKLLHDNFPQELTTDKLAQFFKVSPVAISKILKSRWEPNEEEFNDLERRWEKHTRRRATNLMIESQFNEFIKEKEKQLNMEIPEFFKMELYTIYKSSGIDHLKEDFDDLNDARIAKERSKENDLVNEINL